MATSFVLTLDTTAPVTPTLAIAAGATYVSNPVTTANITTADSPTTGYQILLWGDVDTTANVNIQATEGASAWITYTTSQAISLHSGLGTKTISLKIRDDVHNPTTTVTDTIDLLAAVDSDRSVSYNIYHIVDSDRRVTYNIYNAVDSDRRVTYDILGTLPTTRRVVYDILADLTTERRLAYDIFNVVRADRGIVYDVLSVLDSDRRVTYTIFEYISANRDITYDILNTVDADRLIRWDITTNLIVSERGIVYDVLSTLDADRRIKYNLAIPDAQGTLTWVGY